MATVEQAALSMDDDLGPATVAAMLSVEGGPGKLEDGETHILLMA